MVLLIPHWAAEIRTVHCSRLQQYGSASNEAAYHLHCSGNIEVLKTKLKSRIDIMWIKREWF